MTGEDMTMQQVSLFQNRVLEKTLLNEIKENYN